MRVVLFVRLREGGVINPVIDAVLKRRKMKRTPTVLNIKLDDPRAALADFRKETLKPEDLACFSRRYQETRWYDLRAGCAGTRWLSMTWSSS